MGYLIVRNQDVVKIHISEISILMIETTSVSLTAALLCELTKKKIKVVFCDEKRNPSSELIPYYGSHPDKFEHDEKVEILKMLQKEMIIAGRKECVNNAMKIYCRSIFDALNEGDISLIKFYKDEL